MRVRNAAAVASVGIAMPKQAAQRHARQEAASGRLNVLTLRPILASMPRKPQQPPQPTKTRWHVYKLAAKRQWVGEIEAADEREAIEIAAKEFKQPASKLMAVPQR